LGIFIKFFAHRSEVKHIGAVIFFFLLCLNNNFWDLFNIIIVFKQLFLNIEDFLFLLALFVLEILAAI